MILVRLLHHIPEDEEHRAVIVIFAFYNISNIPTPLN